MCLFLALVNLTNFFDRGTLSAHATLQRGVHLDPDRGADTLKADITWWTFRILFTSFLLGGGEGGVRGTGRGRGTIFY